MKKINIAFVGLGFVSQISHLPNFFYNKKVNLVAICDKNKKILKLLGQKYQTNNIFENIDDLLNSDIKIDLIILSVNREAVYNCSKKILKKK
jgi:predicted dehydrogenase